MGMMPTGPGWWWVKGSRDPVLIALDGGLSISIDGPVTGRPGMGWVALDKYILRMSDWPPDYLIAPIPSPEVCATVAEYSAAISADPDANTYPRFDRAASAFHDAVRAARFPTP